MAVMIAASKTLGYTRIGIGIGVEETKP